MATQCAKRKAVILNTHKYSLQQMPVIWIAIVSTMLMKLTQSNALSQGVVKKSTNHLAILDFFQHAQIMNVQSVIRTHAAYVS